MANHRDRIRIIADVLKAAGKGTRKTRIMCTANLSYRLLFRARNRNYKAKSFQGQYFIFIDADYASRTRIHILLGGF